MTTSFPSTSYFYATRDRLERRHRRVAFAFETIVEGSCESYKGHCQRISTSAMFVNTMNPIPAGRSAVTYFSLPGDLWSFRIPVRTLACVLEDPLRNRLGGNLLVFDGLDAADERRIRSFVATCIDRQEDYAMRPIVWSDLEQDEDPTNAPDILPVRYFGTEINLSHFTENISEGGAFIRTLSPRRVGENLFLDLYLPMNDNVYRVKARVAWRRPPDALGPRGAGMGIEFTSHNEDVVEAVRAFVESFGTEDPELST